ncbi:MAG: pyridoxamine 5'-phosphate oxidase family protein [Elusimicrobia bacterium]|nr:pyridoxamine 5'-phosphate oxidase family protein [Elusimicrobiota bacterium]
MELSSYFDEAKGVGVLATVGKKGEVDVALYAKPRFYDEKNVVLVMADRLSHENLRANPRAAYLFLESGGGYEGKRLILKKVREVVSAPGGRGCPAKPGNGAAKSFQVKFKILKVRPLVGG